MALGEAGRASVVRPRLLHARRASSVNSSVSDFARHDPGSGRDAEAEGRGMRRCTSERSFRGPHAAAVRGAGVEGTGGAAHVQALHAQLPNTPIPSASPRSDVDMMHYPCSTSQSTPLSAPPHSAHVGVSTGGGECLSGSSVLLMLLMFIVDV